jgi:hypothetical protein
MSISLEHLLHYTHLTANLSNNPQSYFSTSSALRMCICTDELKRAKVDKNVKKNPGICPGFFKSAMLEIELIAELQSSFDSSPFNGCIIFWYVDANLVTRLSLKVGNARQEYAVVTTTNFDVVVSLF